MVASSVNGDVSARSNVATTAGAPAGRAATSSTGSAGSNGSVSAKPVSSVVGGPADGRLPRERTDDSEPGSGALGCSVPVASLVSGGSPSSSPSPSPSSSASPGTSTSTAVG